MGYQSAQMSCWKRLWCHPCAHFCQKIPNHLRIRLKIAYAWKRIRLKNHLRIRIRCLYSPKCAWYNELKTALPRNLQHAKPGLAQLLFQWYVTNVSSYVYVKSLKRVTFHQTLLMTLVRNVLIYNGKYLTEYAHFFTLPCCWYLCSASVRNVVHCWWFLWRNVLVC